MAEYVMAQALPDDLLFSTLDQVLVLPSVPYGRRDLLPDVPGLYFAVVDDEVIRYIGISQGSIRRRWASHHQAGLVNGLDLSTRVAFVVIENPSWLRLAEKFAVGSLHPEWNTKLINTDPSAMFSPGFQCEFGDDDDVVLVLDAARELGLSGERVRQLIKAGAIQAGRLSPSMWGIKREEVDRFKSIPVSTTGRPRGSKNRPSPPSPAE